MTGRAYTENEKKIIDDVFGPKPKPPAASKEDQTVVELAKLRARSPLQYDKRRKETADEFGVRVSALDEAVRKQQAHSHDEASALPHWNAPPWPDAVSSAELLESIKAEFEKYIMLPAGCRRNLAVSAPGVADQAMRQDQRHDHSPVSDAAIRTRQQYLGGRVVSMHRGNAADIADR